MKHLLRKVIELLPGRVPWFALEALRRVWYSSARSRYRAEKVLVAKLGNPRSILSGPFAGVSYVPVGYFGASIPKVLGIYERELHGVLRQMCAAGFARWIDIGAAEGYYAVGIAVKSPASEVIAFESYRPARALIREMAAANSVPHRVRILGECTTAALRAALSPEAPTAIVCDCEGAEDVLLDPVANPALRQATILVELHDGYVPGVGQRLRERFAVSHNAHDINGEKRSERDLPPGVSLSKTEFAVATEEGRGLAQWCLFTPREEQQAEGS